MIYHFSIADSINHFRFFSHPSISLELETPHITYNNYVCWTFPIKEDEMKKQLRYLAKMLRTYLRKHLQYTIEDGNISLSLENAALFNAVQREDYQTALKLVLQDIHRFIEQYDGEVITFPITFNQIKITAS